MATRRKLLDRAARLSVLVDDDGESITLCTVQGWRLASTGNHMSTLYRRGWKMADLYDELLDDLAAGLEPCDVVECDYCDEFDALEGYWV